MNLRTISINQLMTLMILFLVASTMLFNISVDAGQNIWVVLIISSLIFVLLFAFYYRLSQLNHFKGLPDIFKSCFGQHLGSLCTLVYGLLFFTRCIMVSNGLTDMIQQTLMLGSSQRLSVTMLLLAVSFACLYGFKIIGRVSEIFFFILIFCLIPFFSTVFSTGVFKLYNLTPVLAEGMTGIEKDIFRIVFFPYGELLVFLMFFQYVANKDKKHIFKRSYVAIFISTLIMIAVGSTTVGILGADLTRNFNFPFYNAMQLAGLRGFLERLDPLAAIIVVLTSFMKATIYLYAAVLSFQSLSKKFNYKKVLVLVAITIIIIAPYIRLEQSKSFHLYTFPFIVLPIFEIGIPLIAWVISEIKSYKANQKTVPLNH